MIRDALLNGIVDSEICRDILGTADILTTAINDVTALLVNKEMTQNRYLPPTCLPCQSLNESKTLLQEKTIKPMKGNHSLLLPPNQSTWLPCPGCKKLLRLYREGSRGWNTRPYTLCLDCFRKRRCN